LHQLEGRLDREPQLREDYNKFMDEYLHLNHMALRQETKAVEEHNIPAYYMPHHAVLKQGSSTTKLRVVFNGSERTSNGTTLNDVLMVGASHQEDLCSLIQRFRTYKIVFCADTAKMYRQILLDPRDTHLQRILWRAVRNECVKVYELKTVTYGTSSAPFLATRCFKQLAEDEGARFPRAAEVVTRDFYVGDLISGTENVDDALQLQEEPREMLTKGGFWLREKFGTP
jgi:hypothetical protein